MSDFAEELELDSFQGAFEQDVDDLREALDSDAWMSSDPQKILALAKSIQSDAEHLASNAEELVKMAQQYALRQNSNNQS